MLLEKSVSNNLTLFSHSLLLYRKVMERATYKNAWQLMKSMNTQEKNKHQQINPANGAVRFTKKQQAIKTKDWLANSFLLCLEIYLMHEY